MNYLLTYYTHRGEAFYNIGPFRSENEALQYANRAHKELHGIGNVSISLLNRPRIEPKYARTGTVFFEEATLEEEYSLY